ncbi:MAG TPA: LysE family transporter [Candidatus Limnocylindrales bacterium]|jgi:threonine/homoserine/homoserine lactone efflux protein
MEAHLVLRGLAIGLGIAAAVGPISILTIRRTLASGFLVGLVSGLGVALADATYGGIAAFGVTAVSDALVGLRRPLGLIGGAFLVWLGMRTLMAATPSEAEANDAGSTSTPDVLPRGLAAAFLSILGLTLTNPMTILSFAAIFAGVGVAGTGPLGAASVTLGVFLGSMTWWVVLTTVVARLRSRVTPGGLRLINIGSGLIVAAFGVAAVATGIAG